MNPFNNRWLALFVVVGLLLVVAELVGTDEHGGVLSQTAQSHSSGERPAVGLAADDPSAPRFEPAPTVVEEVPEDELPQTVTEDDIDDDGDLSGDFSEPEMAADAPPDDEPSDE